MIEFISGAVIGALGFYLVLRNNPKIATKFGFIIDKIDEELNKKDEA